MMPSKVAGGLIGLSMRRLLYKLINPLIAISRALRRAGKEALQGRTWKDTLSRLLVHFGSRPQQGRVDRQLLTQQTNVSGEPYSTAAADLQLKASHVDGLTGRGQNTLSLTPRGRYLSKGLQSSPDGKPCKHGRLIPFPHQPHRNSTIVHRAGRTS